MPNGVTVNITITDHAYRRGKERLGLNRQAFEKMALKAFIAGKKHGETKGNLKKFISGLYTDYRTANNIRTGKAL